jgi:23S rRNA (uracil1939-C5)-methyltransferase
VNETSLVCARLGLDGRGEAERDGRVISAADWLPGEIADVEIEHASPHRARAWARIVGRAGPPSPERVEPPCPGFGRCGGCRLQHASAALQLELKRRRVIEALAAAGLGDVEVAPVVAAPSALGYRNRGKYVFARRGGEPVPRPRRGDSPGAAHPSTGKASRSRIVGLRGEDTTQPGGGGASLVGRYAAVGALVVGAYEPRSHRVAPTLGCRVVEPAIDRAARALAAAVAGSAIPIYDERDKTGALRYAIIRSGADGRAAICLITRSSATRAAVEAIAAAVVGGEISGLEWARNDREDGALLDQRPEPVAGDVEVLERAGGAELRLPITAFAQINRAQAARLVDRLIERLALAPGARVLDAYAGAGAIALALAAAGASVTAVEIDPAAVAAGRRAAAAAGLDVDLRSADASFALDAVADAVVVNPPRKGLHAAARAALIAGAPPRIAYVSCGPESLARDLAGLAGAGYRIDRVEPFDLMPGTPEIETLTLCFKD